MSVKVNQKTGEFHPFVNTWRKLRVVKGLKCDEKMIQHQGFEYDVDGRCLIVVDTELEDRDAYIQSFADECGVYNVLKKYSKTGDASFLNVREGFYGDISDIPEDSLDPAAAAKAAEVALSGLNQKLGTSFTAEELAKLSGDELNDLFNKVIEAAASKVEEVKKEGQENA